MPTVLKIEPYRLYFFSHDLNEPPHIHVDKENNTAKFWIDPVHLTRSVGFSAHELWKIEKIVIENKEKILEAWYGYFNN